MTGMSEAQWEELAIETLVELAWPRATGTDIYPGGIANQRQSIDDLVIAPRFFEALRTLNPGVPLQYLQQAQADILAPKSQDPIAENQRIHAYFVSGYRGLTYIDADGRDQTPTWLW